MKEENEMDVKHEEQSLENSSAAHKETATPQETAAEAVNEVVNENTEEVNFYQAKLQTAAFYFDRMLPKAHGHLACLRNGAKSLMAMSEEQFGLSF